MDEVTKLQQETNDLVSILSLLTTRDPDAEIIDNFQSLGLDDNIPENGTDIDLETDVGVPILLPNLDVVFIQHTALDRLAEVLARFKPDRARGTLDAQESDVKPIVHVVMLKEVNNGSVTFLCAKNEGLDSEDLGFLEMLEDVLQEIQAEQRQNYGYVSGMLEFITSDVYLTNM